MAGFGTSSAEPLGSNITLLVICGLVLKGPLSKITALRSLKFHLNLFHHYDNEDGCFHILLLHDIKIMLHEVRTYFQL
jgi:hypothetical protein